MNAKRIRGIRFVGRSKLPVSAACLIASSVREALSPIVGSVALRLFEPALPSPHGWAAIVSGARIYRVRGTLGEAAVILRPSDAAALAAAAFGETEAPASALSALECAVLDRTVAALGPHFAPICGDALHVERADEPGSLTTYFELQLDRPVQARIGIGLRRDPAVPASPSMALEDLSELPIQLQVRIDAGRLPAALLAGIEPGDVLPLPAGALRAHLVAAGRTLAFGECGVSGNRYAILVDHLPARQGS